MEKTEETDPWILYEKPWKLYMDDLWDTCDK